MQRCTGANIGRLQRCPTTNPANTMLERCPAPVCSFCPEVFTPSGVRVTIGGSPFACCEESARLYCEGDVAGTWVAPPSGLTENDCSYEYFNINAPGAVCTCTQFTGPPPSTGCTGTPFPQQPTHSLRIQVHAFLVTPTTWRVDVSVTGGCNACRYESNVMPVGECPPFILMHIVDCGGAGSDCGDAHVMGAMSVSRP